MASSGTMACVLSRTTDNLIATSRAILAALFLLALWLDPSEPFQYASLTYTILCTYVIYALVVTALVRRKISGYRGVDVITHAVDMLVFSVIVLLTEGSNSPFFVYFIFLLVVSAMRWQWRGTLITASGVMSIAAAVAWCPPGLIQQEEFELNRYLIRLAYLAVVATLLGYLSSHESKLGSILSQLSSSSHSVGSDLQQLALQTLQQSANILDATRVMLLWEEQDEPWLHVATWSQGSFSYLREPPDTFGTIVAEPLLSESFFCHNVRLPHPSIREVGDRLERWEGVPLQRALQERFNIAAVLVTPWDGEKTAGHLLVLDKPHMDAEDLMVAEILSQRAAARFDLYFSQQQMRSAAVSDERIKLARDLHDGLLQSLTAAALQLETAYRQMEGDPQLAQERLRQIQDLIVAEQRALRSHIQQLKPVVAQIPQPAPEITETLEELATRIERLWGLHVELETGELSLAIAPELGREIYFLLHECLVNAAHHAMATSARAVLSLYNGDLLKISVHDNGRGFPFRGRYDLDGLNAMHLGPLALKERISRLGGSLMLTSTEAGSQVDIELYLAAEGGCNVAYNACAGR